MSGAFRSRWRRLRWVAALGVAAGLTVAAAPVVPASASASTGAPRLTVAAGSSASAAPTTTTTLAPAVAQWKEKYESVIGTLADDALVANDTGQQSVKKSTQKKVQATLSACVMWQTDAKQALGQAPPIPSPAMERLWRKLVAASLAASTACRRTLAEGEKSAVKVFRKQVVLVNEYESLLVDQLGSPGE